jgi:hypothetical protein
MNRSIKISLMAGIVVLLVTAGWQGERNLAAARERNAKAVSRAAELGISVDLIGKTDSIRITKRTRGDQDAEDKREAAELIAMIKEADAIEKREGKADAEFEKIMTRLMAMSPGAAGMMIAVAMENQDLSAETREGIVGLLMTKLCVEDPARVLRLLPGLSDICSDKEEAKRIRAILFMSAVGNWGKKDPQAVAAWIRENESKSPEPIDDGVKCGIVYGAASRDPNLAIKLIGELEIGEKEQAIANVARAAKTPQQRTETLTALRGRLGAIVGEDSKAEVMDAAVKLLALGSFNDSFGTASKWIESSGLDPEEMTAVGRSLEFHHIHAEAGEWLDWLGKNLPSAVAGESIGRLMGRWTEVDYQAAGKWLATAPDGLAKHSSIQAYAEKMSKYEPETATQWAMTLPAGEDRDRTLRQIYQNWPREESGSKAAFAKEHGIH